MPMLKDPFLLQHENATELYLIRHGDAIPGPEEIIPSGTYDDLPLSRTGRAQAQKLALRLQTTHFNTVYSSPLKRCQETAAPTLSTLELPLTIIEDLREIHTGDIPTIILPEPGAGESLEALTRAVRARQMETANIAANTGSWDTVSHAETSKDFRRRVVQALDEIVQKHIGERVLIFCHGGVINAYAAEVLKMERDFFFPCANTSLTVIRANNETRVLYILNDIAHLFGE
jgi:probable phosphoglycerate mutase